MKDEDIEPFLDHDNLMLLAKSKIIRLEWQSKPPIETLNKVKVIETWDQFLAHFNPNQWACVDDVPFKWQQD